MYWRPEPTTGRRGRCFYRRRTRRSPNGRGSARLRCHSTRPTLSAWACPPPLSSTPTSASSTTARRGAIPIFRGGDDGGGWRGAGRERRCGRREEPPLGFWGAGWCGCWLRRSAAPSPPSTWLTDRRWRLRASDGERVRAWNWSGNSIRSKKRRGRGKGNEIEGERKALARFVGIYNVMFCKIAAVNLGRWFRWAPGVDGFDLGFDYYVVPGGSGKDEEAVIGVYLLTWRNLDGWCSGDSETLFGRFRLGLWRLKKLIRWW